MVRSIHQASGFTDKKKDLPAGSPEAYAEFSRIVSSRAPVTLLDLLEIRDGAPIPLDQVEPEEDVLWRFMAPGMSEGALSEPAHRAIARAMNVLYRFCRMRFRRAGRPLPEGIGPVANSGEGGFDKERIGRRDGNRSVQYAGARFTITPMTAARAAEAEVKFAQGAKPGKGGQLPGKKVSARIARQRGCEPGYELVSPPVNHNLYSIEDVKLMLESWRHLNPKVNAPSSTWPPTASSSSAWAASTRGPTGFTSPTAAVAPAPPSGSTRSTPECRCSPCCPWCRTCSSRRACATASS